MSLWYVRRCEQDGRQTPLSALWQQRRMSLQMVCAMRCVIWYTKCDQYPARCSNAIPVNAICTMRYMQCTISQCGNITKSAVFTGSNNLWAPTSALVPAHDAKVVSQGAITTLFVIIVMSHLISHWYISRCLYRIVYTRAVHRNCMYQDCIHQIAYHLQDTCKAKAKMSR
jgi:hypothetical protein